MNIQEAYRTPNSFNKKRKSSCHIIIKTPNVLIKERILKAVREKDQVTYKGRPIKITPDFHQRLGKSEVMQNLKKPKCQTQLLYPAKPSITVKAEAKVFHDKNKYTQYPFHKPSTSKDNEWKTPTKGGKRHTRKSKEVTSFHQTQKKLTTKT